jgi:hypothetical protein
MQSHGHVEAGHQQAGYGGGQQDLQKRKGVPLSSVAHG